MQRLERQQQDSYRAALRVLPTQDNVRKLEERVEELEAENTWLRDLLAPIRLTPAAWQLTPTQQHYLLVLLQRPIVSREAIMASVYTARGKDEPEGGDDTVSAHLSLLRRKLKPLGVVIHNRYGQGWYLDPADRERLRAQLLSDGA